MCTLLLHLGSLLLSPDASGCMAHLGPALFAPSPARLPSLFAPSRLHLQEVLRTSSMILLLDPTWICTLLHKRPFVRFLKQNGCGGEVLLLLRSAPRVSRGGGVVVQAPLTFFPRQTSRSGSAWLKREPLEK